MPDIPDQPEDSHDCCATGTARVERCGRESSGYPALSFPDRRHLFEQVLQCIDREDNLVHYRMSWGLQWNVACFAALFALATLAQTQKGFLTYVGMMFVAVIGIVVSVLSFIGIMAAYGQLEFLIRDLEQRLDVQGKNWTHSEFVRPYGDPTGAHRTSRLAAACIPLTLIVVWILSIVYALLASWGEPPYSLAQSIYG